ncbi:aminoglycoside phosphotransferase family protein [Kribbella solani]|nr:aminoglycoside phosphotransferase family protein [Kribbella solani]MDX2968577.1 aminoglycoside phosphotransferase family protein [Kribbella solani]
MGLDVPGSFAVPYVKMFGIEGEEWIAGLPALVQGLLDRWELKRDGDAGAGEASLVFPVVRTDGSRAALKLQQPREETTAALIGLRAWNGDGIVRMLDHDPRSSAMLLQHLDNSRTLVSLEDDDVAITTLAGIMARLHSAPAPERLRGLGDIAYEMLASVPAAVAALPDPDDQRRVRDWASAVTELVGEPGDRMLHWDLHYDNILAADREPWLAIDPEPLVGDPGFDLWPALDSQWDDVVAKGNPLGVLTRPFLIRIPATSTGRGEGAPR